MFNANNFSKRENLIIELMLEDVGVGRLSILVDRAILEINSGLTTAEAVSEVLLKRFFTEPEFNPNDFSIIENIIIECLLKNVNLNKLFKIVEVATNEVEYGSSYSEAVKTAINLNKIVSISVLDLNKMLNDAYYAGWNISREDYNSDSNPCEEDSSSFCYNRDDTISSIINK